MAIARRSAHINVMVDAAEKAGRSLVRDFGEVEQLQVSRKGPGNFVSTADHKAEKLIRELLLKARPKYGFLMEESGETKGEDPACRWIVDPLDGTMNFLHGIPHWCVSIALEKDGEIVAGVIYDPIKDELFWAEKGLGAFMNNRRLQVSGRTSLSEAAIALHHAAYDSIDGLSTLVKSGTIIRNMGSTCLDLAYVAAGRLDAFCKSHISGGLWDVAAGILLVREARGMATDAKMGKNFNTGGSLVAANSTLHKDLAARVKTTDASAKKAGAAAS
ncbi:MAG: inositol monophosphatase family protein [Alphaproteobacteria bacterium]|jgi:myo-inositol-1(or 4)-monophosphatase